METKTIYVPAGQQYYTNFPTTDTKEDEFNDFVGLLHEATFPDVPTHLRRYPSALA